MTEDPCSVCGGTDLKLIDGFYYCVECGTQDINARETIVESTVLADGTFAHTATRKLKKAVKDGLEMSGEWHKWHTYNFILARLTDELIALGAKPTVKLKVLWVWSQYVKKFQDKKEMGVSSRSNSSGDISADVSTTEDEDEDEGSVKKSEKASSKKPVDKKLEKALKDIKIIGKGLFVSILYIALNLDRSDIQLSHLLRYIRERRLSVMDCSKFIPKELDTSKIPHWKSFLRCTREPTPHYIRNMTMSLFKGLNLGTPLVPDLRKLIDNYAAELCLPNDFKDLVFSVMNLVPCDFLYINLNTQKTLVRVPDFEVICMSYVLIAFKMCFGLDGDYEVRLSEVIDKINADENYMKSHRLGSYSPTTDRLFSFREWSNYLQFRKMVLCKYYLPMAHQHEYEVDDRVFMEQSTERPQRKKKLRDEVTMDILNRINLTDDDVGAIPITEFNPTLTPMSTYTKLIIEFIQDPVLKVLLSEDFTQYSLKYSFGGINLATEDRKLLTGVSESYKTINQNIVGTLVSKKTDLSMVFVRNCENKNWRKTKPFMKYIVEEKGEQKDDDSKSEDSDNTNETDMKFSLEEITIKSDIMDEIESSITDCTVEKSEEKELEVIEEEKEGTSIFDDNFENLEIKEEPDDQSSELSRGFPFVFENEIFQQEATVNPDNISSNAWDNQSLSTDVSRQFNPETFDREKTIKELIMIACKKYKIPVPPDYKTPRAPRKRKSDVVHIGAESEPKKPRIVRSRPGENKREEARILRDYYDILEKDILNKVSDQVATVVQNFGLDECDNPVDADHNTEESYDEDVETANHDKSITEGVDEDIHVDDEINIEDFLPKSDPKFDEKTHDISQLYVKFKEKFNLDNLLYDDDPELDKIISKQLEKSTLNEVNSDTDSETDISDSEDHNDDDKEQERVLEAKNRQQRQVLEPFLKDTESFKDFKYWFRHYTCEKMKKNVDLKKFDLELTENFSPSFILVIQECASILGYTAFTLYKSMQDMEQKLISRSR